MKDIADLYCLLNRLHGGQRDDAARRGTQGLLNRLHGGQLSPNTAFIDSALLNRLHGGQPITAPAEGFPTLLNRLHGGQLERYETISLSFKGLHIGTLQ